MAGPFYPPPPTFVGGAQPNAPHADIPQSGPLSQPCAPIVAATFAAILVSWIAPPPPAQGSPNPAASPQSVGALPVVSAPPLLRLDTFFAIRQAWEPPPPLPDESPDLVPASAPAALPPPPTSSPALFGSIIGQWPAPWWPAQPQAQVATQPVVSAPPITSYAQLYEQISTAWLPPPPLPQGSPLFPTSGVAPQQAPVYSTALLEFIVNQSWPPRPVFKYIGGGDTDGAYVVVSPPPPVPQTNFDIIRDQWEDRTWTVIEVAAVAPFVSPQWVQAASYAPFETILKAWEPPPPLPPESPDLVPPSAAATVPPPHLSSAGFFAIRQSWEPAPPLPQQSPKAIPPQVPLFLPPPSTALLESIVGQWPPTWWGAQPQTQIATQPAASAPPLPAVAPWAAIRASWEPAPYALPPQAQIAQIEPQASLALDLTAFYSILDSWLPVFVTPPVAGCVATQPIASRPPSPSSAQFVDLIALSQTPPYALPKGATIASWLAQVGAPSQPPATSAAAFYAIRQAWEPVPWWPLPAVKVGTATYPVASLPPPRSYATLHLTLAQWPAPWWPAQPRVTIAASLPVISRPPPIVSASLRLILQSWDVGNALPQQMRYAPPGPARPLAPNPALLRVVLQSWDASAAAFIYGQFDHQIAPAPSQPPPIYRVNERVLVASWEPPPPLPQLLAPSTTSGLYAADPHFVVAMPYRDFTVTWRNDWEL